LKISQPEHGGNGETSAVVNQWLIDQAADSQGFRVARAACTLPGFETPVAQNPRSSGIICSHPGIFLTVQGCSPLVSREGRKGRFAMFETMTAVMGLIGAGIFLAHAFDGIRSWI
jgi:hypothetical protein